MRSCQHWQCVAQVCAEGEGVGSAGLSQCSSASKGRQHHVERCRVRPRRGLALPYRCESQQMLYFSLFPFLFLFFLTFG